jgi:hypothetical protein
VADLGHLLSTKVMTILAAHVSEKYNWRSALCPR